MKNISTTRKLVCILFFVVVIVMVACRKQGTTAGVLTLSKGHLTSSIPIDKNSEKKIRINQGISVADSTAKSDSVEAMVHTNQYFEWEIMPANGCDSFIGNKHSYYAALIFHCAGTYKVTAKIYDSLKQNLLGTTDTFSFTVTSDTLYPTQPIKKDDTLRITAGGISQNGNTKEIYFNLLLISTKFYNAYGTGLAFDTTSNSSPNNYYITFQDDIKVVNYPFLFGPYNSTTQVGARMFLNVSVGVPINLTITWLGITYTGSFTLNSNYQFTIHWDNSGAVIFTQ